MRRCSRFGTALAAGTFVVAVVTGCSSSTGASGPAVAAVPPGAGAPTTAGSVTTGPAPGRSGDAGTDQGRVGNGTGGSGESGNTDRCTTGELAGSIRHTDAAASNRYALVVLTNTSRRSCALRGFPGVSYVAGDDGHQVGPSAVMQGGYGDPVVIAPGRAAVAPIDEVVVLAFDEAVCRPVPTRGLRIYPPGDTASLFIADPGTGCSGNPPGTQISVEHVRAA